MKNKILLTIFLIYNLLYSSPDFDGLNGDFSYFLSILPIIVLLISPYVIGLFIINLIIAKKKFKKNLKFKIILISFLIAIGETILGILIWQLTYLTYKWFV